MAPARKRQVRLIVSLGAALVLAAALIYFSFSGSAEAVQPSKLIAGATPGKSYQLTGKVVAGTIKKDGATTTFRVRDREGRASVPVRYTGAIPDTFKAGREIIITVRKQGATYQGEKDSLVTKCPSKFTAKE
ncbi:MAG TPA: cytochrome c maturation protein CcmE [Solirubrobacteraceae bacterium]